jgi:cell division protein FtsQ
MAQARRHRTPEPRPRARPWLRILGGLAMLSLAGTGLWLAVERLSDPLAFPIQSVRIEGEIRHLNRERLREVATPVVSGGFFTVQLDAVGEALRALPWVHRVSVRRRWPDTLIVHVEEQRPVARWGEDALLNARGEVFAPPREEFPQGLVALQGEPGRERALLAGLADIERRLAPLGLSVERLYEDARRAWSLRLAGGVEVALGREVREARLERLTAVYARLDTKQRSALARIDLRYTNGLAVAWREPHGTAP